MGLVEERYEFPEGFFDDDEDDDNGDTSEEVIEVDETASEEAEPVPEGPPKRKRGRPRKTEMEIIQDKKAARKKGRTKRTRKTRKKSTVPEKEEIVKFCYTDEKTYTCTCCGRTFTDQKKNFFASDSLMFAGNNKRLPVCRSCVDKMYDYYVDKLGDRVAAVRRMCLKFDYYFNPQIVKNSSLFSAERSVMGNYIGRLNITQNAGTCFDDSIEEETVKAINGELYIIFAYGNNSDTSEMDIVKMDTYPNIDYMMNANNVNNNTTNTTIENTTQNNAVQNAITNAESNVTTNAQ